MTEETMKYLSEKLSEALTQESNLEDFRQDLQQLMPLDVFNKLMRLSIEHLDCNLAKPVMKDMFCTDVLRHMSRIMEAEGKDVVHGFHVLSNYQLVWFGVLNLIIATEEMQFNFTEETKDLQTDEGLDENLGLIEL